MSDASPCTSHNEKEPRAILWDLPTRLFHWSLPVLLSLAWWTAENDELDIHAWIGYTVLVLVVFRVGWGLIGSRHSRFSDFVRGPGAVRDYLRGGGPQYRGHTPPGGWAVLAMLLLLLAQSVSGLFNSDDTFFSGPLHYWASDGLRGFMGEVHELAFNLLLALILLHLSVVLHYQFRRKQPLVQAMWRGRARGRDGSVGTVPVWRALALLLLAAAALWAVIAVAPQPALPW